MFFSFIRFALCFPFVSSRVCRSIVMCFVDFFLFGGYRLLSNKNNNNKKESNIKESSISSTHTHIAKRFIWMHLYGRISWFRLQLIAYTFVMCVQLQRWFHRSQTEREREEKLKSIIPFWNEMRLLPLFHSAEIAFIVRYRKLKNSISRISSRFVVVVFIDDMPIERQISPRLDRLGTVAHT